MLNRRAALALMGSGAATHGLTPAFAANRGGDGTFLHGVASGDPATDGAVIWTWVTPNANTRPDSVALNWAIMRGGSRQRISIHYRLRRPEGDCPAKLAIPPYSAARSSSSMQYGGMM